MINLFLMLKEKMMVLDIEQMVLIWLQSGWQKERPEEQVTSSPRQGKN